MQEHRIHCNGYVSYDTSDDEDMPVVSKISGKLGSSIVSSADHNFTFIPRSLKSFTMKLLEFIRKSTSNLDLLLQDLVAVELYSLKEKSSCLLARSCST